MQQNRFSDRNGFSLIELLTSVAVVVILTTIASPSYLNWYQQTRLKSAARELALFLHRAQHLAIVSHKPVFVVFDHASPSIIRLSDAPACAMSLVCDQANENHQLTITEPVLVVSAAFAGATDYARFSSSTGLAEGSAGAIVLRTTHYAVKIIVNQLGRIRICAIDSVLPGVSQC
ncbi:GspH/FimT family pseudopilin [Salinimonas chungwhensis]|uniref:GspH/FimT family pseudopilin n=1 Tax=Salinimonas chungwhensis TaxID=265425 RepID=UPI00035FBB5E|nr:GspH/FimT family pseudopilin [Salinimonas chungwhensis]